MIGNMLLVRVTCCSSELPCNWVPRVSVWHLPSIVAGISAWQHSRHLLGKVCRIYQKAHRPFPAALLVRGGMP